MENCVIAQDFKHGKNFKCGLFVIIDPGVTVGDNVEIGNYTMIQSGSFIGSGTKIGTHCKIGKNVVIGENCKFTAYDEVRDNCKLGNKVSMGSRGTLSAGSVVQDNVIMKYSFVVTDTPVVEQENIKSVGVLKRGSMFGANVTIMPGVNIGENSEIGACSQVRQDVPPNEIWYGNPAKFFKARKPRDRS